MVRQRTIVATAGRSYEGPSEKFAGGVFRGNVQKLPPNFSDVALMWKSPHATFILGQLLRSLLQNPRNFSEVTPEVRPAVHTALLCLSWTHSFSHFVSGNFSGGTCLWREGRARGPSYCGAADLRNKNSSTNREQKRHTIKNHIKFLTAPWTAGCPWDTRPVSRQKGTFSVSFSIVNNRKSLGHRPVDPPGVPGTPCQCPEDFLNFKCLFLSPSAHTP